MLTLVLLLLVWYVLADRHAPWTDQARVQAWVVPISPKVSGKVFHGRVFSRGFAVKHSSGGAVGEAATIKGNSGWLRDAQRFPVIIHFDNESARGYRAVGGQADVQIYTGDHPVLNALGWLWIRLMSWVSFVY